MPTFDPGSRFPPITLHEETGRPVNPPAGENLYVFYKTTCPTTEMAWPHLERIRLLADGGSLAVVPVSQDDPEETAEFHRRTGFSAPALYDPPPWTVSESLGLWSVPAFFLVGGDGVVRQTALGFERDKMESFAARAAELAGRPFAGLFDPGDTVPAARPG
ncbi:MAG: peroxiredoxin family protein [Thermoanaerobaculia bacterium]